MLSSIIYVFHKFNAFLSTAAGELLKQSTELLLLVIVGYMLFTTWQNSQDRELKYLTIGFFALGVARLIEITILAQAVFESLTKIFLLDKVVILTNFLELFAIIWIANTFMHGIADPERIRKKIRFETGIIILAFFFMEILWIIKLQTLPRLSFLFNLPFAIIALAKLGFLLYPVYHRFKADIQDIYYNKAIIAFIVFSITPLLELIRHLFFGGIAPKLVIIAHPFPFLAIILFIRAIFLKVADKQIIETELEITKKKYEEMKKLTRIKDEFVSIVNHELRTPLTSIKLYISLLKNKKLGKINKKQANALQTMNKESNRLLMLINDILDIAKLEDPNAKLNLKEHDLSELIDDKAYKILTDEKQITVVNNIPQKFLVIVDGGKFKQIFVNLFSNAIKYTDEKGLIQFGAKRNKLKKTWKFWIKDNGRGMQPEALKRVFEKFYQAEDYLTRKEEGSGLGLTIVKHIVSLHAGTIEVNSKLGKGTQFTITLPLKIEEKKK